MLRVFSRLVIKRPSIFRQYSTKMSLLQSQLDSYQRESVNSVISCEKIVGGETYQVVLDNSVLYPEGGGQPWDLGFVDDKEVIKVLKAPGANNHIQLELNSPVTVGSNVKSIVNWERRYDFMQQHTAQHLFSAVADSLFAADTTGWALGVDSVTVDLSKQLTHEQITQIEHECNAYIRLGSPVGMKVYAKADLANPGDGELALMRGGVKGAALELDELRMVRIGDLDLNPCGGTHLKNLSEINLLKVIGTEKKKGGILIRFVSGQRALNYFTECVKRESMLSSKLSVPPTEYTNYLDKLFKERKDTHKKLEIYSFELASFYGNTLATKAQHDGVRVIVEHRVGADLSFLIKAAESVLSVLPDAIVYISGDDQMPVAASSTTAPKKAVPVVNKKSTVEESALVGPYVLFGDLSQFGDVKEGVQSIVSGRGGGRPGKLQGQATHLEKISAVRDYLTGIVSQQQQSKGESDV